MHLHYTTPQSHDELIDSFKKTISLITEEWRTGKYANFAALIFNDVRSVSARGAVSSHWKACSDIVDHYYVLAHKSSSHPSPHRAINEPSNTKPSLSHLFQIRVCTKNHCERKWPFPATLGPDVPPADKLLHLMQKYNSFYNLFRILCVFVKNVWRRNEWRKI